VPIAFRRGPKHSPHDAGYPRSLNRYVVRDRFPGFFQKASHEPDEVENRSPSRRRRSERHRSESVDSGITQPRRRVPVVGQRMTGRREWHRRDASHFARSSPTSTGSSGMLHYRSRRLHGTAQSLDAPGSCDSDAISLMTRNGNILKAKLSATPGHHPEFTLVFSLVPEVWPG
jgi:hypothetical protein